MVYIVVEENYRSTTWCERTIGGIEQRARAKKIKTGIASLDFMSEESDAIVVVGTTPTWIYETVNRLKKTHKAYIILVSNRPYALSVSNVCTDLRAAMKDVLLYLETCSKTRIALYGVNPSSVSDNIKLSAFENRENVYYNFGDLRECRNDFFKDIEKYDAVICTNDYAAISLINSLKKSAPDKMESLFVVGFANTHIAKINTPSVTSVALNYEEYGKTAIDIYQMLLKNPNLNSVNVNVKSEIIVRDTTNNIPFECSLNEGDKTEKADFKFYEDEEIREMVKIEKLFENCNENDISVINMLSEGRSYESTAESCFMTVNGIKYRLDRLCRICGFNNRKELINAMKSKSID